MLKIEKEYSTEIRRNLKGKWRGHPFILDGAFSHNGKLHVVEVRFTARSGDAYRYNSDLVRLAEFHGSLSTPENCEILFVLVTMLPSQEHSNLVKDMQNQAKAMNLPIVVRGYALDGLQDEFGADLAL